MADTIVTASTRASAAWTAILAETLSLAVNAASRPAGRLVLALLALGRPCSKLPAWPSSNTSTPSAWVDNSLSRLLAGSVGDGVVISGCWVEDVDATGPLVGSDVVGDVVGDNVVTSGCWVEDVVSVGGEVGTLDGVLVVGTELGSLEDGGKVGALDNGASDGAFEDGAKDGVLDDGAKDGASDGALVVGPELGVLDDGAEDGAPDGVLEDGTEDGTLEVGTEVV